MTMEMTISSDFNEDSFKNLFNCLNCPVCNIKYTEPFELTCGHVCCKDCLNLDFDDNTQFCPICLEKIVKKKTYRRDDIDKIMNKTNMLEKILKSLSNISNSNQAIKTPTTQEKTNKKNPSVGINVRIDSQTTNSPLISPQNTWLQRIFSTQSPPVNKDKENESTTKKNEKNELEAIVEVSERINSKISKNKSSNKLGKSFEERLNEDEELNKSFNFELTNVKDADSTINVNNNNNKTHHEANKNNSQQDSNSSIELLPLDLSINSRRRAKEDLRTNNSEVKYGLRFIKPLDLSKKRQADTADSLLAILNHIHEDEEMDFFSSNSRGTSSSSLVSQNKKIKLTQHPSVDLQIQPINEEKLNISEQVDPDLEEDLFFEAAEEIHNDNENENLATKTAKKNIINTPIDYSVVVVKDTEAVYNDSETLEPEDISESLKASIQMPPTIQQEVIEKPKTYFFTSSRLNRIQTQNLQDLCKLCNGNITSEFTNDISHLIVNLDEGRVPQTIKYILAIAGKKWIVTSNWVEDCLAHNKMIFEEPYETTTDNFPECEEGAKYSRLSLSNPFENLDFFIFADLQDLGITRVDCKKLLKLLGGNIVDKPTASKRQNNSYVVYGSDSELSSEGYEKKFAPHGWKKMSWDWIYSGILNYKFDFDELE